MTDNKHYELKLKLESEIKLKIEKKLQLESEINLTMKSIDETKNRKMME